MKNISKMIPAEKMINYLEGMMETYLEYKEEFGADDWYVKKKRQAMIDCKCMVENLIGMPVNLGRDGTVTVGF